MPLSEYTLTPTLVAAVGYSTATNRNYLTSVLMHRSQEFVAVVSGTCAVCNRNRFLDGGGYKNARVAKELPRPLKTSIADRSLWLLNHAVKLPEIIHVKLHGFELFFSSKDVTSLSPIHHVL